MLISRWLRFVVLCLGVAALQPAAVLAQTQVAPDPTGRGPYQVASAEYKLPARRDVLVAPFTVTELWARIYRPTTATGPRPLIVMLHGNHGTCGRFDPEIPGRVDDDSTYTDTGTCPEGYVVVPSHDGYAYLANQLASWGYYVVSINANRGVNAAWGDDDDFGLNLRRGRLILRHLIQLERWNVSNGSAAVLGFNLRGSLDFSQIGLLGHSRGGEGIRAALAQYRDVGSIWPSQFRTKPVFRALFEIAPVDGQTNRVLNADGVAWSVLLPTCDGDVSDLQGQRVFDRMITERAETRPAPKAMFTVEGANHNFYNTEWQQSDSQECYSTDPAQPVVFDPAATGSAAQRTTALYPVTAFFRAHLGTDPAPVFGQLLDPAFRMPGRLTRASRFRRSYIDTAARKGSIVFDDFRLPVGAGETGIGNLTGSLSHFTQGTLTEHDPVAQFGTIAWDRTVLSRGSVPFYQANAAMPGSGLTVDGFNTLEFRLGLACKAFAEADLYGCEADPALNPSGSTDFSIVLVLADGTITPPVYLARYARPLAPVGLGFGGGPIIINDEPTETSQPVNPILPGNEPPNEPSGIGRPVLQSVRIPLADFGLANGVRVRGVRMFFNRAAKGAIYLGNVRITRPLGTDIGSDAAPLSAPMAQADASDAAVAAAMVTPSSARRPASRLIAGGHVTRILREKRTIATASQVIGSARQSTAPQSASPSPPPWPSAREVVSVMISVPERLTIGGSLLTLRIGDQTFRLGQAVPIATQGLKAARFYLPPAAFAALPDGAAMTLENGGQQFDLGPLDKALLR